MRPEKHGENNEREASQSPHEYAEYCWIEVSKTTHRNVPPKMVKLADLQEWIDKVGDEDIYSSFYRYAVDDPNVGSVLGGLAFDLDCQENPEKARKEAIALVLDLKNGFDIPEENIAILFTGSKGFRVIANRRSFDFEPSPFLPLIHKSMAKELAEALKLKTVDFKIYHRRALLRLENSKHPKTGLFQIRLTFNELQNLNMNGIRQLAIKPRSLKMPVLNQVSQKAHEFYTKHKKLVEQSLSERKEAFNPEEITPLPSMVPCAAKRFELGSEEGMRNTSIFQLSVYWAKQGKSLEEIKNLALEFNERCKPPLDRMEVVRTVESAFNGAIEGRYSVGCSSEAFYDLCPGKNSCPFFTKEPAKKSVPPEIREKAWALVKSPAFFYELGKLFEKGFYIPKIADFRYVLGEERNKRLLPFLMSSAALVRVIGEPGTAKDTLVRMCAVLLSKALKIEERTDITPGVLKYSEKIKAADVLYIPDSPSLRGEQGRQLRFMRSDEGGIAAEYVFKDPETGKLTTEVSQLPIKSFITTSNEIAIDRALETGMWTLKTSESEELTKLVRKEKLRAWAGKHEFASEEEVQTWQEALRILIQEQPVEKVVIPYAENLEDLLDKLGAESRRDPDKLCRLIDIVAKFRRFQKPENKRAEADLADLYIALELGMDAFMETFAPVNEEEKRLIQLIDEDTNVTVQKLAKKTGQAQRTIYKKLERLVDKGFLTKQKVNRANVYEILKKPKELLSTSLLSSLGFFWQKGQENSSVDVSSASPPVVHPISGETKILGPPHPYPNGEAGEMPAGA